MPNVYFAGLFAVLILAAAAGIYVKGGNDREAKVRVEYQQRDLKAASDYAAKERQITDAYRKKEAKWSQSLAAISKDYQKRIAANETQRLADMAAVDARTIVLRDPNAADCKAGGSGSGETAGTASGRDGTKGGELPAATSRFLLGLAGEADALVSQLSACQQVLIDERR